MKVFYQDHFLAGYEIFSERWLMTLSQLTTIDKLEVIAFCQYSDKLSSYIADTHFQMWQIKNLLRH